MKKKILRSSLCALAIILGSSNVTAYAKTAKTKTKVAVSKKKKTSKNKTIVLYADSTTKKVKKLKVKKAKWSTSNKKVATVKNGKITAKKKGKAIIKARTKKKAQTWKVTVKKVSISESKLKLKAGKSKKLKLNGEKIKSVKTSNRKIASVSKKGNVKAIKKGSCVITIKGKNKKNYKCKVSVSKAKKSTTNTEEETKKTVAQKAAEYSYSIEPVLAPFCEYYLVTTDNPDITQIRFTGTSTTGDEVALTYDEREYADVSYYDESTKQVKKNTYLFMLGKKDKVNIYAYSNPVSGSLTLEATSDQYEPSTISYSGSLVGSTTKIRHFEKSDKQFTLPGGLESTTDYLIQNYADTVNGTLFDKLDAVQKGLGSLAVYPRNPADRSTGSNVYPLLCASPYAENSLNAHTDIYPRSSKEVFTEYVYPFLLDSAGFPAEMKAVAKKLDPNCTITKGSNHSHFKVTSGSETKTYGGQGTGSYNDLYIDLIGKDYRFDGNDLLSGGLSTIRAKYLEYGKASDTAQKELAKQLDKTEVAKVISQNNTGDWLRIGLEGSGSIQYAFGITGYESQTVYINGAKYMSDCWTDGRYINKYECWEKGAHFSDHPTADILLTNQTYSASGKEVKGNILYKYISSLNIWVDSAYVYSINKYPSKYTIEYITQKIKISYLTQDDVAKLSVDRNTDTEPTSGYIYDGTAQPGTKFGG